MQTVGRESERTIAAGDIRDVEEDATTEGDEGVPLGSEVGRLPVVAGAGTSSSL